MDIFGFVSHMQYPDWNENNFADVTIDIRRGQVWRLWTPALLHLGAFHLIFNMYWLYYLGGMIEDRKGKLKFVVLLLTAGLISSVAQATFESPWFFGMSGVNYALFGYIWMKTFLAPEEGMILSDITITCFFASYVDRPGLLRII